MLITVAVAGYRASQAPQAAHELKVYMKRNEGNLVHNSIGDAWSWAVEGELDQVTADITEMFGHLKDIKVIKF